PDRLVALFETPKGSDDLNDFSYPDYVDYRDQSRDVLEGIIAHDLVQAALGVGGRGHQEGAQSEVVWGQTVTGNFFDVLQVRMHAGRGFLPEEDRTPGSHPVVVLSHALWLNRFEGDRGVVGKTISLNGHPFTVVGVTDAKFTGAKWALGLDFWAPLMMQEQLTGARNWGEARGSHWLEVLARLKPGVTHEQAAAALTGIAARLERAYPDDRGKDVRVRVLPEQDGRWGEMGSMVRLSSWMAVAVVGLILFVACANVANLLLARAVARRREIGIRLALGAGRGRIVQQMLTESLLLSLVGGAAGLLVAYWLTDMMTAFFPVIPYTIALDMAPDSRALVYALAVTLLTGVMFGLAPALQASNPDVVPELKGGTRAAGHRRRRLTLRNALVVAQVALSLVVLVCAGLFVKSFRNAKAINPGFATDHVLLAHVNPGLFGYEKEQGRDFYRRLLEHVRQLPGVESAGAAYWLPLGDSSSGWGPVSRADQPAPPPGEGQGAMANMVAPGYFDAVGMPLLRGRDFEERDREGVEHEAVVINEALAARLWPGEDPTGKLLRVGRTDPSVLEVVGVVKDAKYRTLGEPQRDHLFVSLDQTYRPGVFLVVRTKGNPAAYVGGVREAVRGLDPRMPLYAVKTMREHLTWAWWAPNMAASLSTAFGLLALALAATGLYSVIAYSVSQRTREIGIRMALGAQPRDVLRAVAGQGVRLLLVGMAAGLAAALAATRVLTSLLYGVSATDPAVLAVIVLLLSAVALLASYVPARRATKVDPMVALRYE
ncbi:MAG TPA: ABC transporter permease, partial [Pyrinomonadaceae bacterium]|nr:ABC transporter permease [Pyrinomonadaceae bacterium]